MIFNSRVFILYIYRLDIIIMIKVCDDIIIFKDIKSSKRLNDLKCRN